ncbi:MAG: hypothetical protein ABI132_07315 [Rhodanobacteraceae bacterium]
MKLTILAAASALLLSSCAATYKAPDTTTATTSVAVSASEADILRAAKQALVADGYQLTNSDDSAGVISTAPRDLHVTPSQVNCGTTMGIDYLKDKRTSTRVAFGIIAADHSLTVKANVQGEYKPGAVDQNITLTCVSRGVLEQDIISKILGALPH